MGLLRWNGVSLRFHIGIKLLQHLFAEIDKKLIHVFILHLLNKIGNLRRDGAHPSNLFVRTATGTAVAAVFSAGRAVDAGFEMHTYLYL